MALNKLREAHKAELKLRNDILKLVNVERPKREIVSQSTESVHKITFDLEKLEKSVDKFKQTTESLKKKTIIVLDKNPVPVVPKVTVPVVATVSICQARNINGTPCKCKATKLGKFCAKHAP